MKFNWPINGLSRPARWSMYKIMAKPMARAIKVASMEPVRPMAGIGPKPKIKMGSSTMLLMATVIMAIPGPPVCPLPRRAPMPDMVMIKRAMPERARIMGHMSMSRMSAEAPMSPNIWWWNNNKPNATKLPMMVATTRPTRK